ncbi:MULTISPECIES: ABC transporter permease subunit [Burkholderia cepacia complex]|uniref:Ribose transport system permease protein RbsC n=2 Tax=Burkholderia cepacia complex TaxID=87882 RepID=B9BHF4_9BURK|nr:MULTISPECIES: ribose ABC transporter permease [Burkholderia cepacia complex]AIO34947.1 branched-chain amino acid transport system / permease component family protein [Burkholderia cenocepacia]EEE09019.1 ribose transport system permease protein RbsC [Burkholderia multivorans CGD2]EEE14938.1 ribose transport system permease protein RbsC [Burkholderia multivorans CGD2M]KWI50748.1 ribose ABC transporter permease [Burkholderia pseudomultivorans]MBU9141682.1 ribose ABC transporter permease [Burkh
MSKSTIDGQAAAAAAVEGVGLSSHHVRIRRLVGAVGMLPVLVILCLVFNFMTQGTFFTAENIAIVGQQAAINTVLAAGMTFVILTGGIDLSVGSMLATAAMTAMLCSLSPALGAFALPVGLATGVVLGLFNGILIAYLKLPPFIVTLGSLTAVRGLARLIGDDGTVMNPNLSFAWIGNAHILGVPVLAIIALAVIVISWFILRRTVLGIWIYALGGNTAAARLSGIKVSLILLFVYSVSGLLSGLGGVMSAARLYAANGLQIGQGYELDAIAAVILGGTSFIGGVGSIWGTLVGALIIAVLSNGLIIVGVSDIWQFIIKGLVIIAAVTLDRYRHNGAART